MIEPRTLEQMLEHDPLAPVQSAIVATLRQHLAGITIEKHPGKVDISELVKKAVVRAPGIGVGWSRVRETFLMDGASCFAVEWVAYVVAEAKAIAGKRREKEEVGLAIGSHVLSILADPNVSLWGRTGVLPIEEKPGAELKPFFTIKDAEQGTAYYVVTWSQIVADLTPSIFPADIGQVSNDLTAVHYGDPASIDKIRPWIVMGDDDA
jgi:hypothetical protein